MTIYNYELKNINIMKQKILTLLCFFTSICCSAQKSEFIYIENPLMPHFTYIMQDGLFYQINEEPSDNNTFGKVLMVSYEMMASFGADVEKPIGKVVIPTAIQNGEGDFADKYRIVFIDANFDDCDEITGVTFPENMRGVMIQGISFKNTKKLKNVKFPNAIPNMYLAPAFQGSGIEELTLPNGIKSIHHNTFENSKINKLVIPSSVNEINSTAFRNCINLSHVYLHAQTPPTIDGSEVLFTDKVTVHVPASSLKNYKNDTTWNNYNIVGDL